MAFKLSISTPDRTFFEGEADELVAPGLAGSFGVLARHAPMICALGAGVLKARIDGAVRLFVIDSGTAEVAHDQVAILADQLQEASDPADAEQKLQSVATAEQMRSTLTH